MVKRRQVEAGVLCLSMAVGLMACQSDSVQPLGEVAPLSEEEIASSEAASKQVFPSDFEDACQGAPVVQAAAYDATPGEVNPIYLMGRDGENDSYVNYTSYLPDAWQKEWEQAAETELVVCVTATERTLAQTCEFEEEGEPTYKLETYNTTYQAEVREAKTGKLLVEETIAAKADGDCPTFHMFTEGELLDKEDASYEQAVLDLAKPHVQPEA